MYIGLKKPALEVREGVDGNWKCGSCNNINFATREQCNRCGAPKPPPEVLEARMAELASGKRATPVEGIDGNWGCPNCGNVNWWQREFCNRCHAPKPTPEELVSRASELANGVTTPSAVGVSASKTPLASNEANWRCPACGNINWPQRTVCNRCSAPRPVDDSQMQMQLQMQVQQMQQMQQMQQQLQLQIPGLEQSGQPSAEVQEIRTRQTQLETQMSTLQATLLPQVASLSTALQQMQTVVLQLQHSMSGQPTGAEQQVSPGALVLGKRKSEES
mmetsp:Transcript_40625/g.67479  ORF Transcript_40625/g.67479 Transcript_40625/m.67479 type:complete len:275 (-) Transcript_40625:507-1331(-)|eukprot:CAMPEP_0119300192 /NCGR_PEP_ID=MMETSP1333-20130426/2186_1 /TAXON_ID=418940 /ORGANISM="Scyphosphaera apsteinii, Strain RCC1455" /LENGTH=274 /DNA_ID=CAMNT_0007301883 /DNA_START=106 /DNA_END=930 /DNA_ORIENTATION=-